MKKIILLTSLFLTASSYCLEQQEDPISPIVDELKEEIDNLPLPISENWNNLSLFLKSERAEQFNKQIISLSSRDKERLMQNIYSKIDNYRQIINATVLGGIQAISLWPVKRDFLAAIVETDSNCNINKLLPSLNSNGTVVYAQTFLTKSIQDDDLQGVKFALNHGANVALKPWSDDHFPLFYARNYPIAKLLVDHQAFEPFKNNPPEIDALLYISMYAPHEAKLLKFYNEIGKKYNLNLKSKDSEGRTFLMTLCNYAAYHKQQEFFEKFKTLFQAGAVDLNARTNTGLTALDVIKQKDQDNATVKLARALLEGLEKTPAERRKKLELLQQNPPENPVGLQELLYPMKNPRIFQSTQLSEKE